MQNVLSYFTLQVGMSHVWLPLFPNWADSWLWLLSFSRRSEETVQLCWSGRKKHCVLIHWHSGRYEFVSQSCLTGTYLCWCSSIKRLHQIIIIWCNLSVYMNIQMKLENNLPWHKIRQLSVALFSYLQHSTQVWKRVR